MSRIFQKVSAIVDIHVMCVLISSLPQWSFVNVAGSCDVTATHAENIGSCLSSIRPGLISTTVLWDVELKLLWLWFRALIVSAKVEKILHKLHIGLTMTF